MENKFEICYNAIYSLAMKIWDDFAEPRRNMRATRHERDMLIPELIHFISKVENKKEITIEFLANEVGIRDRQLLDRWTGSDSDLAWLMTHEELSSFFTKFAKRWWNPDLIFIHHVPKAGGTSVYRAISDCGFFVSYPQTFFEEMARIHGIFGFSNQLQQYERLWRNDRIYVGGHYNLFAELSRIQAGHPVHGVSLVRDPSAILSSSLRYVWTMLEQEDKVICDLYGPKIAVSPKEIRKAAVELMDPRAAEQMRVALLEIFNSDAFHEEYSEPLEKYYGKQSDTLLDCLDIFFRDNDNFFVSTKIERDAEHILRSLDITQTLPHENLSIISHRQLVAFLGGHDNFSRYVEPLVSRSNVIYSKLEKWNRIRSQLHQRLTSANSRKFISNNSANFVEIHSDTLERLKRVFLQLFSLENGFLHVDTFFTEIEGWNAASQVYLILGIEEEFGISLPGSVLRSAHTVINLARLIETHTTR